MLFLQFSYVQLITLCCLLPILKEDTYFEGAYAEDGYTRNEYNTHPALIRTAEQFPKATGEMVEFVRNCIENYHS